jgi:hypothetical protein
MSISIQRLFQGISTNHAKRQEMLFFTPPNGHKKASSFYLQVSCLGAGNYTYRPPIKVLGLSLSFRRFLFVKKIPYF